MTAHRQTFETADGRTHGMTTAACAALALAACLLAGTSVQAPAQTPDHVYGGCVLDPATVAALAADASVDGGESSAEVSFVVVYTLSNDNDGQSLGESGFTGPVICINEDEVGITASEADETPLTEASDIPTETDPGGATTVDILETEESFIIKYQLDDGDNAGAIEKRVCHTVDGNVDCFIIFPTAFEEPG